MDEKKTPQEKQQETVPQDRTLTDRELEEASGGTRPPASVYHDKPFF